MGSLKILQYSDLHSIAEDKPHKKKPLQNLLGVLKASPDPNHSPLGSPPIEKKRVRRLSNSLMASTRKCASAEGKENHGPQHHSPQPILKKIQPSGRPLSCPAPTRCSHNRNVVFNGNVLVQYIGDTDTCYEPLHTAEVQDRQNFLTRNTLRRLQSHMVGSDHIPIDSMSCMPPFQMPAENSSNSNSSPLTSKNVNISFSQNSRNVTVMKFVVFMGPQYDPANIVVKANMSGNRLRVVASLVRIDSSKDQYNERFQLPMQVDPYKVEARLDARGYLTVNAPLIEQSSSISI